MIIEKFSIFLQQRKRNPSKNEKEFYQFSSFFLYFLFWEKLDEEVYFSLYNLFFGIIKFLVKEMGF